MEFTVDRSIKKAVYKQIAEYIESEIVSGKLLPGQLLPSERELADELQVNRSTIITAYDELQSDGLVVRKKRSGTYISQEIWVGPRKRIPNWGMYLEGGMTLPNLPIVQKLRNETLKNEIINLASGELSSDLLPSNQLASILKEFPFQEPLGYAHPLGSEPLRKTICRHMETYKKTLLQPESVLITSGAQQAIHLIVQCLLKPGDTVAVENPSYAFSLPIFRSAGIRVLLLPVDENGVNPDDIISLQRKHRIRMLFLNPDHQNPTGTKMSLERRKRILELSSDYGMPIVEDDPYSLTSFDGEVGPALKSMDDSGNVLYVSSLSKIVAPGLRVGWVIGPREVIERLADGKQQIDFGHSVLSQWVANQFLSSPDFDDHILNLRKQLKARRDEAVSTLERLSDNKIVCFVPRGGIHLWCRVGPEIDEYSLFEEAMKGGVAFVPGSIMGSDKGYARFTYGRANCQQIREGLTRFIQTLQKMNEG